MAITQKQRLGEAQYIANKFHSWMGFHVCDGEEDMLALRKLVKKIEREAVAEEKKKYRKLDKIATKYANQISLWADGVSYEDMMSGKE